MITDEGQQYPGGPIFGQALIHHIWMESQGRNQWELSYQRNLTALGVAPDFTVEREEFVSKVG